MKIIRFLSEKIQFLVVKFSIYLNRRVFVMQHINIFKLLITRHTPPAQECLSKFLRLVLYSFSEAKYIHTLKIHRINLISTYLSAFDFNIKNFNASLIQIDISMHKSIYTWCPIKWTLANSVEPDQTSRSAASNKILHCLHLRQELI